MVHEAPYQAYVKAGRFVPSFGLRLDDYTSHIGRSFELAGALPEPRVTGVELGAMSNYPFVNAAWFRIMARGRVPDRFVDDGWGSAVNAGWRDLSWSVGGSAAFRRRSVDEGGDTSPYSMYGVLNLWRTWRRHEREAQPTECRALLSLVRIPTFSLPPASRIDTLPR